MSEIAMSSLNAIRGRKPRRVLQGEGMVTPVKPLLLKEAGRSERVLPRRHRFAPDYPAVLEHPEWFRPADPSDLITARHHREVLERAVRRRENGPPRSGRPRRLASVSRRVWKLP